MEEEKNVTTEKSVESANSEKKEKSKKNDATKEKSGISQFFTNIKGEFKKIIWPGKNELGKQTVTVIVTCLIFGVVIMAMDAVFTVLFTLFTQYLG